MAALLTPQTAFYLVAAVVLMTALGALLVLRPETGLLLVALAMALTLNLRFSRGDDVRALAINAGGVFSVGLLDVLAVLMITVAAFRRVWRGSLAIWELAVWSMVVLTGVNTIRGLSEFPLEQVANEVRPWLYLWATIAFSGSVTLTRGMRRTLAAGLVGYGFWLIGAAVLGFSVTGVNGVTATTYIDGNLVDPRPVAASGALVLAEALVVLIAFRRRISRLLWLLAASATGLVVILLQHRTMWVATALALAYIAVAGLWKGGHARLAAAGGVAGGIALAVMARVTGVFHDTVLASSASNAVGEHNTFLWRVLGWQQLVGDDRGRLDSVLGKPFGSGFLRVVNDVTLTVSAHSQYVSTYLRLGFLGLVAVALLVGIAWRAAAPAGAVLGVAPTLLRGLVILVVLYGATYSWDPFQGVVLGLLIAFGRGPAAGRVREPDAVAAGSAPATQRSPALAGIAVPSSTA